MPNTVQQTKNHLILALCAIGLALCGCGITSPQDVGRANTFSLRAVPGVEKPAAALLGRLVVSLPKANAELDTYRIALLRDGDRQDYYASARWADFLPVIVQSALIESLQNSGHFAVVTSDHAGISANYQLESNIQLFHADYTQSDPPSIVVRIYFTLLETKTSKVMESFVVEKTGTAHANQITSIHKGFNAIFSSVQKEAIAHIFARLAK